MLLEVEGLRLQRSGRWIIDSMSLSMRPGEFLCVLGPNGAGKSTLLRSVIGLAAGAEGTVKLKNRGIASFSSAELAAFAAYVPQGYETFFPHRVLEFVQMGRFAHLNGLGWFAQADHAIVQECLELCRVADLKSRRLPDLSGGERQRVLLAAALAKEPELLVLDEPTTFLDPRHRDEVVEVLNDIRSRRRLAILAATHEINLAAICADSVLAVKAGQVVFHGPPDDFMRADILRDLYDREFLFVAHPRDGRQMVLQDY